MSSTPPPTAFVLAPCAHGSLIVNVNDRAGMDEGGFGVGYQILRNGCFDPREVRLALAILDARRLAFGDGVAAVDGGANIGVHTVEWARHMTGWGRVEAFEPQERVFYALAGNVAL